MSSYQKGMDAYDRGDYDTALKEFRPLAEQGYPLAQATLGLMYAEGEGVAQEYQEAAKWIRLAATQGNGERVQGGWWKFQLIRRVNAAESEDGAIELVRSRGKMVPLWATLIGWAGVLCGVVHLASQEV